MVTMYTISTNPLNYIYHEIYGKIRQSTWNISVFINDSRGIVLYALDSADKVLIEIRSDHTSNPIIIVKLNDDKKIINLQNLCGCRKCKWKYFNFITKLGEKKLTMKCNNKLDFIVHLYSMSNKGDSFKTFPIPIDYNKNTEKIFIWMGNIGPYEGYNHIQCYPDKEQLIGCLEYFYFNNQILKINNQSHGLFKSSCITNIINETIHQHGKQYNTIKSVNMFDCSLPFINDKYCDKIEMLVYSQINQSYVRHDITDKSIEIILAWKQINSKNYCLIEINLRNGFILSFQSDSTNQIILKIFKIASDDNPTMKILNKISLDIINYLLIQFDENNFIVKISNGNQLDTFIYKKLNEPFIINIGNSNKSDRCETFEGFLGFKYNSSQFTINLLKHIDNGPHNISYISTVYQKSFTMLLVIIVIIIFVVLVYLLIIQLPLLIVNYRKKRKNLEINCNEEQIQL